MGKTKAIEERELANIKNARLKTLDFEVPFPDVETGAYIYSEVLPFLAIYFYKKIPNYKILFGLASYAMTKNGLTEKQRKIADDFISFSKARGIL